MWDFHQNLAALPWAAALRGAPVVYLGSERSSDVQKPKKEKATKAFGVLFGVFNCLENGLGTNIWE